MDTNKLFTYEQFIKRVNVATNQIKADLVLKNANYVNVFTESIEKADIAISDGYFVGIGEYNGLEEIDCSNKIISPGLIDSHVHMESSMLSPKNFRDLVVAHGTCCVVADPHEITNVAGFDGINYIIESSKDLDLKICVMIPSCVPCTYFDESGAVLLAKDIKHLYKNDNIYGLAEMMDMFGIINGNKESIKKCVDCLNENKLIDGHAPILDGNNLNAYLSMCISTDHECDNIHNAIEKIKRGQWIEIREGTVCRNLSDLIDLFKYPYYQRCMLSTDDNHPDTLLIKGHIDKIIRKAIDLGADPIIAIKLGSLNPAIHYGLKYYGAIANGYLANFIILNDLKTFDIDKVYIEGKKVAENNKVIYNHKDDDNNMFDTQFDKIFNSFNVKKISKNDIMYNNNKQYLRAIEIIPGGVVTKEYVTKLNIDNNYSFGVNIKEDIAKIIVVERYNNTGHIGIGFIKGYGIKKGAIASSIGHDSHNIIAVGVNDDDIVCVVNKLIDNKGGLCISLNHKILGELILEVGGLMTEKDEQYVIYTLDKLKDIAHIDLGVFNTVDPFMTLSFMQLPVIPDLKINTLGMIDVKNQKIVDPIFDK